MLDPMVPSLLDATGVLERPDQWSSSHPINNDKQQTSARRDRSPLAPAKTLSSTRNHPQLYTGEIGGAERDRTDDLLLAKQALSQLSYSPMSQVLHLS